MTLQRVEGVRVIVHGVLETDERQKLAAEGTQTRGVEVVFLPYRCCCHGEDDFDNSTRESSSAAAGVVRANQRRVPTCLLDTQEWHERPDDKIEGLKATARPGACE